MPKRVNLRFTAFFDHLRKAGRFDFEELHSGASRALAIPSKPKPEARATLLKESPPENYGKKDQTTVAAFLPWRVRKSSIHSP